MKIRIFVCTATLVALSLAQKEVSAADGTIKPFQAGTIKPIEAHTIKPFQAEPIKPVQAQEMKPSQSGTIAPVEGKGIEQGKGKTIAPEEGGVIEPFHAEVMKPLNPPGIDVAKGQRRLQKALVGIWDLYIPGVAYQTETDRGAYTERKMNVGTGAGFGTLKISEKGQFEWTKNGVTEKGKLVRVIPHNYGDPKRSYWRIRHGREILYIATEKEGELTVYSPGTNLFAAGGKKREETKGK